jgi:membrane-associated protein
MEIFNPEFLIQYGGLTLLLIIIFAETGLFFGFFLPGDSLLFIAGLLSDTEYIRQPVGVLILELIIAAVAGTCVGYFFGSWAGDRLKHRPEGFFYRRKYLDMADKFYQRYGLMAFVVGRFLPVIRTFIPILSGMIKVPFPRFFFFNVVGAVGWICSLVLAGYFLGGMFPGLIAYIEYIIVAMIVITAVPVIIAYRRNGATPGD